MATNARSILLADAVLAELKTGIFQENADMVRQIQPQLNRINLDKLTTIITPRGDLRSNPARGYRQCDYLIDVGVFQAIPGTEEQLDDRLEPLVLLAEEYSDHLSKTSRRRLEGMTWINGDLANGGTDLFWRKQLEAGNVFAWILRLTYRTQVSDGT